MKAPTYIEKNLVTDFQRELQNIQSLNIIFQR